MEATVWGLCIAVVIVNMAIEMKTPVGVAYKIDSTIARGRLVYFSLVDKGLALHLIKKVIESIAYLLIY
jgi:hypothetical protein